MSVQEPVIPMATATRASAVSTTQAHIALDG
jgi:hypothetical protein